MSGDNCVFCRIIRGELPSKKVYEDDAMFAFHDIHPQAPVHFMVVPKQHIESLAEVTTAEADLMGKIFTRIPSMAKEQGLTDGWRTIINTGRVGCQDVYHIHIHVVGGNDPLGPMLPRR